MNVSSRGRAMVEAARRNLREIEAPRSVGPLEEEDDEEDDGDPESPVALDATRMYSNLYSG